MDQGDSTWHMRANEVLYDVEAEYKAWHAKNKSGKRTYLISKVSKWSMPG